MISLNLTPGLYIIICVSVLVGCFYLMQRHALNKNFTELAEKKIKKEGNSNACKKEKNLS